MADPKLVIIGGGLAGLSTGCYARANGFDVTIFEHNLALGGVCTAWHRGPYLVDGCIHWLTGGPFLQIYKELGIVPAVALRPLEEFATYRHARDKWEVSLHHDLKQTAQALRELAPEDADEISRILEAADKIADLAPPVDHAPEVASAIDRLRGLWELRHGLATFVRFHQPASAWAEQHLKSARLRTLFQRLFPGDAPALFLIFILGYLGRGWLSRPVGGTASFRDALIKRYASLGGCAVLNTTVEEILVSNGRATGVRLTDGTMIDADIVVSTSSGPETVFRLLAGRFGASEWRSRMDQWKMFQPIVLASYGVALPFNDQPSTLVVDGIEPLTIGGYVNEHLVLRIQNEEDTFAPAGHTVVQAMLMTEYDWWATRGARYQQEKDLTAERVLEGIDRHLPGARAGVQMRDLATPLSYWRGARAWRGAFEGWIPTASNAFTHVSKELPGLKNFYMAGQWVEPGGGVPTATMSGRHVVEIICAELGRPFTPSPGDQASA